MCNSTINNSLSVFEQNILWLCICNGNFGTNLIFYTLLVFLTLGAPIQCSAIRLLVGEKFKPCSVFPLNISIGELGFSLLCFINLIITVYPTASGDQLSAFLIGLCWTIRPLLQVCMCIEHYLAVIHPLTFMRYKGIQYRVALAGAAWIFAVGNSVRLVFIGVEYFPDHVFFLIFCITVITILFCCTSVLNALKHSGPGDRSNVETPEKNKHNKTGGGRAVENQQKRKAFQIISHVLISILVCYCPQVVAYFMRMAHISKHIYICNAFPSILSFSLTAVLISPLMKMYNEGQLKQIQFFSRIIAKIQGR